VVRLGRGANVDCLHSAANAINNNGLIVGWCASSRGDARAILCQGMRLIDLDNLP